MIILKILLTYEGLLKIPERRISTIPESHVFQVQNPEKKSFEDDLFRLRNIFILVRILFFIIIIFNILTKKIINIVMVCCRLLEALKYYYIIIILNFKIRCLYLFLNIITIILKNINTC